MAEFRQVLENNSPFRCQDPYFICNAARLRKINPDQPHIQVLWHDTKHHIGHWKSIYYKDKCVYVYDSAGRKLQQEDLYFLSYLIPKHYQIAYEQVQRQQGKFNCGIFAMAFATSLALGM